MSLTTRTTRTTRTNNIKFTQLLLGLPFWLTLIFWSILPSTKTPTFEIELVPFNTKDLVNIAVACFYLFLPAINNRPIINCRKPWDNYLQILTVGLVIYAIMSVEWSEMNASDALAMRYTLILTVSAALLGYHLIAKRSVESVRPFLWGVTVCITAVGLLYSADAFFSLGLGTPIAYESYEFGLQRVRGPLFTSTTGFLFLVPALAFSIQELTLSSSQRLFKLIVAFSLMVTIIGLGSRSAFMLLATFFLLLILFMKNKKQAGIILLVVIIMSSVAGLIIFSKAKTDRFQSFEDSTRSGTFVTSMRIMEQRSDDINFFGSGYGSYWHWYMIENNQDRQTVLNNSMVWTPYGSLLYHPHSTFLLCIVELGVPGLIFFASLWIVLTRLLLSNLKGAAFPILNCGLFASGFSMFFDLFIFKSSQVNTIWWIYLFGALALNSGINSGKKQTNSHAKKVEKSK